MAVLNSNVQILRKLISELRFASFSGSLKESPAIEYILHQYKKLKVTDQQLCKAQEEMKYMSETYLCYLRSTRRYSDLHKQYQGKGERSTEETANLVGFKLPHDPNFTKTVQDILKCPRNHFRIGELESCRPHLNCGDLDDMTFVRRLGSGAVKDVFLVDWNNIPIAMSVPVDSKVLEDFMDGVETLRLLNPSKYVVQYLGFCETKYALFSEYHLNGDAAALFNSSKYKPSLKQSVGYCHQYAEILNFLHNIPVGGPRVFCDSNSLEKLLSQLLVTTDLKLILNDVDALPQVVNGSGIKCGHRQLFGKFVAPEQLWNSSDQFDDSLMTGYDEKTDIWKAPAVCEYFLNLSEDAEILKYRLFDLHKRCRNIEPSRRPCVNELVDEYQRVFDELDKHSEL